MTHARKFKGYGNGSDIVDKATDAYKQAIELGLDATLTSVHRVEPNAADNPLQHYRWTEFTLTVSYPVEVEAESEP